MYSINSNIVKTGRNLLVLGFLSTSVLFTSCTEDKPEDQPQPTNNTPTQYSFENVNYGGQTARLLLIRDLVAKVEESKTTPVTAASLLAIYENTAGLYTDISTGKKLSDKVANPADDAQLRAWFDSVEVNSKAGKGLILANGWDLKHAIEKTLMGTVIYHRAVNDYLKKSAAADNNNVTAGEGTKMQHGWDEAFGYFGAARDYNNYTDALIINPGQKDANGDGTIDVKSEKNFYYAQTAAKRDVNAAAFAAGSQTDFTKVMFDAFLAGRNAIDKKEYTTRDESVNTILTNWDKLIAATVVHYINEVKKDKASGNANLATHWSEMVGYFRMIGYNPDKKLTQAQTTDIATAFGTGVNDVTNEKLDNAAAILKSAYGFTDQQIQSW